MGGWCHFSEDLSDVLQAFVRTHDNLADTELFTAAQKEPGLADMMASEDMGPDAFQAFLDDPYTQFIRGKFVPVVASAVGGGTVGLAELRREFPCHRLVEVTDREQAVAQVASMASCSWGAGRTLPGGWTQLASPSPHHQGDACVMFVCRTSLLG